MAVTAKETTTEIETPQLARRGGLTRANALLYGSILVVSVASPMLWPDYTIQMSVLWLMVVFALTWDILGGHMGYNSLGNIFFFGAGMYTSAVVQIGLFHPVGEYTYAAGLETFTFTPTQYYIGIFAGIIAAGVAKANADRGRTAPRGIGRPG
jgi:branched-chain amino acid transport system permease protein